MEMRDATTGAMSSTHLHDQPWHVLGSLIFVVCGGLFPRSPEVSWLWTAYVLTGANVLPAVWGRYAGSRVAAASGGFALALAVIAQAEVQGANTLVAQVALATLLALAGRFFGERQDARELAGT